MRHIFIMMFEGAVGDILNLFVFHMDFWFYCGKVYVSPYLWDLLIINAGGETGSWQYHTNFLLVFKDIICCMPCRLKKNLKTLTKYLYLELFIFFLINKFPNSVNFCAFNYKNSPQFCFITCIYPNFTNKYLLDICVLFFSLKLKFVFCDLYYWSLIPMELNFLTKPNPFKIFIKKLKTFNWGNWVPQSTFEAKLVRLNRVNNIFEGDL